LNLAREKKAGVLPANEVRIFHGECFRKKKNFYCSCNDQACQIKREAS